MNDDPTCPAKACANFLGYPQWDEPYGIAGKSISRIYLARDRPTSSQVSLDPKVEGSNPSRPISERPANVVRVCESASSDCLLGRGGLDSAS